MQSGLSAELVELVYLRISQINNCAYCLDMHTRNLIKKGVKIEKLALYEPPVLLSDHSATLARMDELIRSGDREGALMVFMRDIVMISEDELRRSAPPR